MIKYLKNQGNYKISDFKGMSYNDIRPIFENIWDFNQKIKPMDTEHGSGKQMSLQKSLEKSHAKEKSLEKVVEEEFETEEEFKEGVKEPAAKRKKSIPRKSTKKRQKLEEDAKKGELKGFLDIVPREEAPIEVESISTKFPIMDWKTCVLTETFKLDVEELFRLVKERFSTSRPEGFDLMLWGDLHTLFEPDKDDKIWRDQHEYNLLSMRLCDFCEEREKFTIEERAKLLHDTIAAQWRFLTQQRSEVIRNKLPSRTQLRNQMVKSIKEESKEEEGTKKRKLGTRKKMKSRKRRFRKDTSEDDETNSEKENNELRLCLSIVSDEDKEVDYEILDKKYPIIEWKSEYLGIKPQYDKTKDLEEINLNVVIRSNGS
ncbi:hypothetical protein Tco_0405450 [Tanacetum coccineum]